MTDKREGKLTCCLFTGGLVGHTEFQLLLEYPRIRWAKDSEKIKLDRVGLRNCIPLVDIIPFDTMSFIAKWVEEY